MGLHGAISQNVVIFMIMYLRFLQHVGKILTTYAAISFSIRTRLHMIAGQPAVPSSDTPKITWVRLTNPECVNPYYDNNRDTANGDHNTPSIPSTHFAVDDTLSPPSKKHTINYFPAML
jgi:hypothetical protein